MDPVWTRLKTSTLESDAGKEGVRLEIKGGFKMVDKTKKPQKAFVEFLCDRNRVGDENLWVPEDKYEDGKSKRDESNDGTPSLQFVGYETSSKDIDVLNLSWRTKFACEDAKGEKDAEKSSHWGFFTWFIIMYVSLPFIPA